MRLDDRPTLSYSLQDWQKGYRSLPDEYEYDLDAVEGQIPVELEGTLFRNGPGMLELNGQRVHHPFDGDGMVCAIAFKNGRAHFRNRYVRTQAYVEEQQAQKFLYRGVFGTRKAGGWLANAFDLRLKNIANTNIIYWGNKLLALWEAAEPYRLDPATLDTIGRDDLNGELASGDAFSAHPRIDPACQQAGGQPRLVNFAIKPGLSTTITIFEMDLAGQIVHRHSHAVPGFAFIHDFAITPNYCIFFQYPISYNPFPYLFGLKGAGQCLKLHRNQPSKILVIPRHTSDPIQTFSVDAGFVFHHANAFEQGDRIVVDSICYAEIPELEPDQDFLAIDFSSLAPGQLWRFTLDLTAQQVNNRRLEGRSSEFPVVHPQLVGRDYHYVYMGATHDADGNAPLQAIEKLNVVTGHSTLWSAAPRGFSGEPIFVPRTDDPVTETNEDDGWLLLLSFNAEWERSDLVILDARDLTLVARLPLKHHVPYGLHGSFSRHVF